MSAIFDDGKSLKRGIAAIFFVIKFITKFSDKKWKISEEYKNLRDYLEISERCYCATCVANLDHHVPVLSLTEEKCKKKDKKEGLLDSVIEYQPRSLEISLVESSTRQCFNGD